MFLFTAIVSRKTIYGQFSYNHLMIRKYILLSVLLFSLVGVASAQLPEKYIYFKGDSLDSYGAGQAYRAAVEFSLMHHLNTNEMARYIYNQQRQFIKRKYHLSDDRSLQVIDPALFRTLSAPCSNVDFENGDYTGWTGFIGYNAASGKPLTMTANGVNTLGTNSAETSCSYHTLVTAAGGNDPWGVFPMIDPSGGTYAERLGGDNINSVLLNTSCTYGGPSSQSPGEVLEQTFTVSKSNSLFTYKYAVVLNDGGHNQGEQPYFKIEVLDNAGNPIPCLQYYEEAIKGKLPPGFTLSNDVNPSDGSEVYYIPWSANALNLSAYVGQVLTVRFTAAGCIFGQHFGYGYVDCSCSPVQITFSPHNACQGSVIQMIAPPGADAYQWTKIPAGPGIVGPTNTQTISVNQSGTYEVKVTTGTCTYTIDTTFNFLPYPVLSVSTTNVTCNGAHNGSVSVTVSGATPPYVFSWNTSPSQTGSVASGLSPGTYSITVAGPGGCATSATATITEPASLVSSQAHTDVSCNGGANGSAQVGAVGGTLPYIYSWSPAVSSVASATGLSANTYTITLRDANNCSSVQVITVSQPTALASNISSTQVSCSGGSNGTASVQVTGGTPPYIYNWSPSGGTGQGASGLAAGTYTCTIHDANNCSLVKTITVAQPTALTETLSSTPVSCNGGSNGTASVHVTGGTLPYSYNWSPSGGTGPGASGLAAGTYTCTIHDANNCSLLKTITIVQPSALTETLSCTPVSCNGGSNGTANAFASGGTQPYIYSWAPTAGTGPSVSGLSAQTYTCTISDANGCQVVKAISVSQPPSLTLSLSTTPVSCNGGNNGTAAAVGGGGTSPYIYQWTPAGGTSAAASGLTANTYTCTLHDANGCIINKTISVVQPTSLVLSLSSTSAACNGGSGIATATVSGATPPYLYSWTPTGGKVATAGNLPAGTYTCTVHDANSCSVSQTVVVTQPQLLTLALTSTPASCNGSSNGTATATESGGTPPYTYSWIPGGYKSGNVSGLSAGTYTCILHDSKGCSISQTVMVAQPAPLTFTLSSTPVSCNGGSNGTASLTVKGGTPVYQYSWSAGTGAASASISSLSAGTDSFRITDSHGCVALGTVTITQPKVLVSSTTTTPATCRNNNGSATVSVSGGKKPYTFSWSPGAASGTTATGLISGTYTCTVSDSNGCHTEVLATVVNNGAMPVAVIASSGPTTFCAGQQVTLTASGGTSYSWNTGAGTPSITASTAGTYWVHVSNFCGTDSSKVAVILKPQPNPVIISSDARICKGDSAQLSVSGGSSYTWSTGSLDSIIYVKSTGSYTVTASNGCGSASAVSSLVVNSEYAFFTENATAGSVPFDVSFKDASVPPGKQWAWDFGDGTVSSSADPFHVYPNPGSYTVSLHVTDSNGCKGVYQILIETKEPPSWVLVPNVFTPNDDGTNDQFIVSSKGLSTLRVSIYDRWGVVLAELHAPNDAWDGRTQGGVMVSAGTYFYELHAEALEGKIYNLQGFVQLIR
jgi:gliding motility-associated-like protein